MFNVQSTALIGVSRKSVNNQPLYISRYTVSNSTARRMFLPPLFCLPSHDSFNKYPTAIGSTKAQWGVII